MPNFVGLLPLVLASLQADLPPRATELFLEHCASCHGAKGDGRGTTKLDRPARSFLEGGFSYGNTPEAVFRTLSFGIPGTPMPAFDTSLDEAERRLLARYVLALGPPGSRTDPAETVLEVGQRPRIVRGLLPPIGPEGVEHPRGLLLGLPSGLTFEYRTDDVRLLGVRQGAFCERTDWIGRGGTALRPLGQPIYRVQGGRPDPLFGLDHRPLAARLRGTWIRDRRAGVRYALLDGEGRPVGLVEEEVQALRAGFAAGFLRRLTIRGTRADTALTLTILAPREGAPYQPLQSSPGYEWLVLAGKDGTTELRGIPSPFPRVAEAGPGVSLRIPATHRGPLTLALPVLLTSAWDARAREGLARLRLPR